MVLCACSYRDAELAAAVEEGRAPRIERVELKPPGKTRGQRCLEGVGSLLTCLWGCVCYFAPQRRRLAQDDDDDEEFKLQRGPKKPGFLCPWWCLVVPWFLLITMSLLCGFFTILYTFSFGFERSIEWLYTLTVAFITDVFIMQPAKVILFAAIFSFIIKRSDMEEIELTIVTDKEERLTSEQVAERRELLTQLKKLDFYRPPPQVRVRRSRLCFLNAIALYCIVHDCSVRVRTTG